MEEKNREVPMESREQVERIKEILPDCSARDIYEALKDCKMDSDDAAQRLLSQETGKKRERSPREWKENFNWIREMIRLTEEDREGIPMEWKEQVERIKEMVPCFTEETIYQVLEQCYIDSDLTLPRLLPPETRSNSGSLMENLSPSSAKSSVASQLHSVSLDKGKEVVWHTVDGATTTSRNNVQALHAKAPWSSHAVQAGSDPMALGNNVTCSSRNDSGYNVALGSSEFLEYKLFTSPTKQYGISLTLNDLEAYTDQLSELHRTSTSETSSQSGPSEATLSNSAMSGIHSCKDPQDPVLDAPFACSRYGPIQHPGRMCASGQSEVTPINLLRCSIPSNQTNSPDLPSLRINHIDGHSVSNHNNAAWNLQPDSGAMSVLPPSTNTLASPDGRLCLLKQTSSGVKDLHCNMVIEAP